MRIGVLASGGGTNLQSIIDACESGRLSAEMALVISNNSSAGALERARKAGISSLHISGVTYPDSSSLDRAILNALTESGVDLVALAGYMKKLGSMTLHAYRNKVLNIHPALLPDFGGQGMYGMAVHRAVLASGVTVTGPTVHLVNEKYDEGAILAQSEVPVLHDDTAQSLQSRVLEVEHRIYPETIENLNRGIIAVYEGHMDTIIRPLRVRRDFEAAAKVVRSAFRASAVNYPSHPVFMDIDEIKRTVESGGVFFGAYRESRMIGCVAVKPSPDDVSTWHLIELTVLPENRFVGFGSLLLDHAGKAISIYGGGKISIGLMDADSMLKDWYRRRGFTEAEKKSLQHVPFDMCYMNREVK